MTDNQSTDAAMTHEPMLEGVTDATLTEQVARAYRRGYYPRLPDDMMAEELTPKELAGAEAAIAAMQAARTITSTAEGDRTAALPAKPGPLRDEIMRLHDRYVLAEGDIEDPQAVARAAVYARKCRQILNTIANPSPALVSDGGGAG